MLKGKILSPPSKVKIFLEVNFSPVLLFQEIKAALHQPIVQIKMVQVLQTLTLTLRARPYLLNKKFFLALKVLIL
jgi:hypothetical protein